MVYEVKFREDLLPFKEWFVAVLLNHCVESVWDFRKVRPRIDTHLWTADRKEIDLVITCRGKKICIELKEADFEKAVHQAIGYIESRVCNLAYIAINYHVYNILDLVRTKPDLMRKVFEYGIGIVATLDGVVVFRAFEKKTASRKYANLLELVENIDSHYSCQNTVDDSDNT